VRVGGDRLSGWPSRPTSNFFAGVVDETAVYRTQLTGQRVAAHYRASGRTLDQSEAPMGRDEEAPMGRDDRTSAQTGSGPRPSQ
jgi:hypothetical protein